MVRRHAVLDRVLGATGVYARHLIPRLVARGHRVRALVRRPEAAAIAAACGAELHRADVFDAASLRAGLAGCDVGINLATSLPGPSGRGDFATNDRVRRDGTPVWVDACRDAGVPRIVQQSIAMVNAAGGDAWGDEDTDYAGPRDDVAGLAAAAALAMEDSVRRSDRDWMILRGRALLRTRHGLRRRLVRPRAGRTIARARPTVGLRLARPHRRHGGGDRRGRRAVAVAADPHRRRRRAGALARRLHVRRRGRRRRAAVAGRASGLSVVPRTQCPRARGVGVGAVVRDLPRRPRALSVPQRFDLLEAALPGRRVRLRLLVGGEHLRGRAAPLQGRRPG
jgi:uncharacterized protein YbjT (DUF2867 family)